MNPHLVKDLHIDYYEDESVVRNGKEVLVAIATSTMATKERYFQYLSIHEELHAKIVSSMPSSKDLMTKFKREKIASDYMKAFINMKDNMYEQGLAPSEIKDLMGLRKHNTADMKYVLERYIKNKLKLTNGDFSLLERVVFNSINSKVEIDAISLNTDNNRESQSKELQNTLFRLEYNIINFLEYVKSIYNEKTSSLVSPLEFPYFISKFVLASDLKNKRFPNPKAICEEIMGSEYPHNVPKQMFILPYDEKKISPETSKKMFLDLMRRYN